MRKAQFTEHQIITVLKSVEAGRTESSKMSATKREYQRPRITSMDYLRFASTESGFGLLLTSIRHQENLCPNG